MIVDEPLQDTIRPTLPEGRIQIQLEAPLSDEEFWAFCRQNETLTIEQNPDGTLIIMPPTGGSSGNRNFHINKHLAQWVDATGNGFGFDSSTMFHLPGGAKRMPDAAWVAGDRYRALRPEERDGIVPLAPDFVVELRSPTDPLDVLKNKMNEYMRAGVRLGWLIDPETETVTVYHEDRAPDTLDRPETVEANSVVEGFTLPMARIWDPLDA
jgi:Uma2 family endonuclease